MKSIRVIAIACLLGTVSLPESVKARQPIGELDLNAYCASQGFERSELSRERVGYQAAYGNWFCIKRDSKKMINLEKACQWQYPKYELFAWPLDPDDAFTWRCFESINPVSKR